MSKNWKNKKIKDSGADKEWIRGYFGEKTPENKPHAIHGILDDLTDIGSAENEKEVDQVIANLRELGDQEIKF